LTVAFGKSSREDTGNGQKEFFPINAFAVFLPLRRLLALLHFIFFANQGDAYVLEDPARD
jgi:hypothetical protein